jgi:hypothetical protein
MDATRAQTEKKPAFLSSSTDAQFRTHVGFDAGDFNVQISEVMMLFGRTFETDDEGVNQYCVQHTQSMIQRRINRINARISELYTLWPGATGNELYTAFEACEESFENLFRSLGADDFRQQIISKVQQMFEELQFGPDSLSETRSHDDSNSLIDSNNDSRRHSDSDDDSDFTLDTGRSRRQRTGRTTVDVSMHSHPCPSDVDPTVWSRWSETRKRSYFKETANPNAYYYRHLPHGEIQRNGAWTESEKRMFLDRMRELRGDATSFGHDWGLFSRAIPGRVGYQCSNFYRTLLLSGELEDDQYVRGEDGRLHHTSRIRDGQVQTYRKGKNRKPEATKKSRGRKVNEKSSDVERPLGRYEAWAAQNPIPGAVDFITGEVMQVPAISPDGYVLDYRTWLNALTQAPVNPFTQNHLTKRQLVVLTTENYAEYAQKIVNLKDN